MQFISFNLGSPRILLSNCSIYSFISGFILSLCHFLKMQFSYCQEMLAYHSPISQTLKLFVIRMTSEAIERNNIHCGNASKELGLFSKTTKFKLTL